MGGPTGASPLSGLGRHGGGFSVKRRLAPQGALGGCSPGRRQTQALRPRERFTDPRAWKQWRSLHPIADELGYVQSSGFDEDHT
jgi:hypothetical protein